MRLLALARALGLLIGAGLALAFVLDGRPAAMETGPANRAPVITAGQTGSLEISPQEVITLPRGGAAKRSTRATMRVRNTSENPLDTQFSAVAPGSGSKLYRLRITSRGRLLFKGTPQQLQSRSTSEFRVAPQRVVPIRITATAQGQPPGPGAEQPRSFELQWTTGLAKPRSRR